MLKRIFLAIVFVVSAGCWPALADSARGARDLSFSDLFKAASAGEITKAWLSDSGPGAKVELKDGGVAYVATPPGLGGWVGDLVKTGVDVRIEHGKVAPPAAGDWWNGKIAEASSVLQVVTVTALPLAGLVLVLWMMRNMQGKGGVGAFILPGAAGAVKFDDVAGAEEAKETLADIVDYLKDPEKFEALGGRQRRGVLLVGPPGNGKTLVARAMAEEAGVPFMAVSGSAFQEMFAGLGAARVRKMFKKLRKKGPCILFIDEVEAVGRRRSSGGSLEIDASNTLNELLVAMDGIDKVSGVIVIAATNRVEILDEALLRPGRFDLQVTVPPPGLRAREAILRVHAKKVKLAPDVDLRAVARSTPGFSGADLAHLINEAAIRTAKRGGAEVTDHDIEEAKDVKLLGGETQKENILDETEAETVAVHESGHAIVSLLEEGFDPIHKGSVTPRGRALGVVVSTPLRDRALLSKSYLMSKLVVLMGGRAAEEVKFGGDLITSGAVSDIEEATKIARAMVSRMGMGSRISNRVPGSDAAVGLSQKSMEQVDAEVEAFVKGALDRAIEVLSANVGALDALSARFREDQTLSGDEIRSVVRAAIEAAKETTPAIPAEAA